MLVCTFFALVIKGNIFSRKKRAVIFTWIVFGISFSSVVIVNTLFTWPKLLSAAYLLIVYGLLFEEKRYEVPPWVWILSVGAGTALAMLAHGGAIFALAAMFMIYIFKHIRQIKIFIAGTVFFITYAPWFYYQKLIDPPGDRLIKWHLAGVIDIDSNSFVESFSNSFSKIGFIGWLDGRLDNLLVIIRGFFVFDLVGVLSWWSKSTTLDVFPKSFFGAFYSLWFFSPFLGSCYSWYISPGIE